MTRRRSVAACAALIGCAAVYALATSLLPPGSRSRTGVADLGFVVLELILLGFCVLAYRRAKGTHDRWVWLLLGIWALGSLFGDSTWAYYEVLRNVEAPIPGVADLGYLAAYLCPIAVVLAANWRALGPLKSLENNLDAAIFTLGAAGLAWPLLLGPMYAGSQHDLGFWVDFSYPVLDVLIVFAFLSLLFGYYDRPARRPPLYFIFICLAFLLQVAADSSYFATVQGGSEYGPGGWADSIFALSYASGAIAAVLGIRTVEVTAAHIATGRAPVRVLSKNILPAWRTALPYMTIPVLTAMISMQVAGGNWRWNLDTKVLLYMGVVMVILLVSRQYVAILRNRALYRDLADVSRQLENRVAELADVNQRLEHLNDSSHRLTSLRQSQAVARAGLEIACSFTGSRGGWIDIGEGVDVAVVTYGEVEHHAHDDAETRAAAVETGSLQAVPLSIRGELLGTMWLLEPSAAGQSTTLLPLVSAQLASALDNAGRYEEALQLAERDPLTGLYNHRGIHRRLAGEALRAQQSEAELSLVMIDLDDFKVLNDTYGHAAGDSVLRQVSDATRLVLRHADLAGRVGGDEILLVLPNTGAEGAMQLGERLRVALAARPYLTSTGQSVPVYLSLGVATMPADAQSVGQLLEVADANLYTSKQHGGNTTTGSGSIAEDGPEDHGLADIAHRLLDAVGARDHYTRRHSEHVVRNAVALGQELGLSQESLLTLKTAAMLHDVGNIGVSPDLLRKPGSLDRAEEDEVRSHVGLGSALIMDMPRLADVVAAVSAHHERYDGSGYPAQTAGEDTPLLGRILAVADAYSAMTLDRPYRTSMSRRQAREELLRSAGTQLDPELVRVFVHILDEREESPTGEQSAVV